MEHCYRSAYYLKARVLKSKHWCPLPLGPLAMRLVCFKLNPAAVHQAVSVKCGETPTLCQLGAWTIACANGVAEVCFIPVVANRPGWGFETDSIFPPFNLRLIIYFIYCLS